MLGDGETIPADQVSYPVDLDDYNRMFDEKTRQAVQTNLQGFGNAPAPGSGVDAVAPRSSQG